MRNYLEMQILCGQDLGFGILATRGTAAHLEQAGVKDVEVVLKIQEGRPNAADLMKNKDIQMMMITSTGNEPDVRDGKNLRRLSLALKVCSREHRLPYALSWWSKLNLATTYMYWHVGHRDSRALPHISSQHQILLHLSKASAHISIKERMSVMGDEHAAHIRMRCILAWN